MKEDVSENKEFTVHNDYEIVGVSKYIRSLREKIKKASENDSHVLITGPTGSGKELVARNIHYRKHKNYDKFFPINCASIPSSLFESELFGVEKATATGVDKRDGFIKKAEGGTLFLDEIGDLAKDNQAKILRFLDDKTYVTIGGRTNISANVKIVAATNKDLKSEINNDEFRLDLYQRLAGRLINTEHITDEIGDVICLVNHFFSKYKINDPCIKLLLYAYDYPEGNVRELKNMCNYDYKEVLNIVEERRNNISKLNNLKDEIKLERMEDDLEILEDSLSTIGPSDGIDPERDEYYEWYGDLSNYGFDDDSREKLRSMKLDVINNRIMNLPHKDILNSIANLEKKRSSALTRRNRDILDRRLRFYEIVVLAQKYSCSKNEITKYLHIHDRELNSERFKRKYHFDYPGDIQYLVTSPSDVFPDPVTDKDYD